VNSLNLRKDDFYVPILGLLERLGGSASIEEIEAQLIEEFQFSPDDLGTVYEKSGALVIPDKISWSRSYLKLAGLVNNERRGVWVLTDEGRQCLAGGLPEVARQVSEAVKAYNSARTASLARTGPTGDDEDSEPESWADKLLMMMQRIEPAEFERLCQRLLRESGFTRVEVTGKSGDGGIDGQGVLRVNLVSFHVLFQCKRYLGSVGAGVIRDFRGAMQGRADKGLVITTGTFTSDARREATRDGAPAIDLIDGEALCLLLKERGLGVKIKLVEEVSVDESFFAEL
jgi:restriction system protein